jgi:hypothetical protein
LHYSFPVRVSPTLDRDIPKLACNPLYTGVIPGRRIVSHRWTKLEEGLVGDDDGPSTPQGHRARLLRAIQTFRLNSLIQNVSALVHGVTGLS